MHPKLGAHQNFQDSSNHNQTNSDQRRTRFTPNNPKRKFFRFRESISRAAMNPGIQFNGTAANSNSFSQPGRRLDSPIPQGRSGFSGMDGNYRAQPTHHHYAGPSTVTNFFFCQPGNYTVNFNGQTMGRTGGQFYGVNRQMSASPDLANQQQGPSKQSYYKP